MDPRLEELLRLASDIRMTPEDRAVQRVSFAYGNTHFENEAVTRDTVRRASEQLRTSNTTGCAVSETLFASRKQVASEVVLESLKQEHGSIE